MKPLAGVGDWTPVGIRAETDMQNPATEAPREVIGKSWRRHVLPEEGGFDLHAYTFCVLDELRTALKHRDVFVARSWRYADPHAGLLDGT